MRARPTGRYDQVAQASAAVVIECYSTSVGWATRLLAEPVRTHVRCIYALVRVADELVDDVDLAWDRGQRAALLDALEEDTRRALQIGGSPNLVVHAFARTAVEHGIGWDLVGPFFDSMRADLDVAAHDPDSFATYVYGAAEVVGLSSRKTDPGHLLAVLDAIRDRLELNIEYHSHGPEPERSVEAIRSLLCGIAEQHAAAGVS